MMNAVHQIFAQALAPFAPRITSDALYCMGMESETADRLMPQLCAALRIPYPPELSPRECAQAAEAFPDPFTESSQLRQSATDSRR